VAFRKRIYTILESLQADLDNSITGYNGHAAQGAGVTARRPTSTFLNTNPTRQVININRRLTVGQNTPFRHQTGHCQIIIGLLHLIAACRAPTVAAIG